jgi:uncharacterized Fe-S center protein
MEKEISRRNFLKTGAVALGIERIESRSGLHQLECMKTLHMGNDQYELITL